MSYGICHTPLFGFFCSSSSSSSVELAYRKSGTSTLLGFCMKRLLSLSCVILDQENLRNFTRKCIIQNFLICSLLLEAILKLCARACARLKRARAGVEEGGAHIITLCRMAPTRTRPLPQLITPERYSYKVTLGNLGRGVTPDISDVYPCNSLKIQPIIF